jgi:hypothetical protein
MIATIRLQPVLSYLVSGMSLMLVGSTSSILEKLGLAKVKKSIPKIRTQEVQQIPNADLLASVIHHRYEIMARYAKTLRQDKVCARG